MVKKKKVAIIGTNGIPARYGGFETLTEYLAQYLSGNFDVVVYCSKIYNKSERKQFYKEARLIYLPLKANGLQSAIYDIISTLHAWFTADILLVLGPAAGFILPLNVFFQKKIIVNHGGLNEWEREKYSRFSQKLIKLNHYLAAKFAFKNIADNIPLSENLTNTFKVKSQVIEYGGDHISKLPIDENSKVKYSFLNKPYVLSVSRAQIDNNLHILLDVFKNLPDHNLVIVSNWNISDYGKNLLNIYAGYKNIYMVSAVYDKTELDIIRSNTSLYIHSHSRCGTAPSLVEAMNYNIPIICFDVDTNRATTNNESFYFSNNIELKNLILKLDENELFELKERMYNLARIKYRWEIIAKKYSDIFEY